MAMTAGPNDRRYLNSQAMGDDRSKIEVTARPLPGSPQSSNNMDGNPNNALITPSSNGMQNLYYDGGVPQSHPGVGVVGVSMPSGAPQNMLVRPAGMLNRIPIGHPGAGAPDGMPAEQMIAMAAANSAAQKNMTQSAAIGPMGIMGSQTPMPGNVPGQMPQQTARTIPFQRGINTGNGGRNQQPNQ